MEVIEVEEETRVHNNNKSNQAQQQGQEEEEEQEQEQVIIIQPLPRWDDSYRKKNYIKFLWRNLTLDEISGSFGDLATFIPLIVALNKKKQINITSSFVFGGIFNILSGLCFGLPLCVQPMKSIAAFALSGNLSQEQIMASGFLVSVIIFILSITKTIPILYYKVIPLPIVRGIQLGTGMTLVMNGVKYIGGGGGGGGGGWGFGGYEWMDNYFIVIIYFILCLIMYHHSKCNLSALILFIIGIVISILRITTTVTTTPTINTTTTNNDDNMFVIPTGQDWRIGFLNASLGQLPLTLLNSVIAVAKLADDLYPERNPPPPPPPPQKKMIIRSTQNNDGDDDDTNNNNNINNNTRIITIIITRIGLFVGMMNMTSMWFGCIPFCSGAGGFAAQYRFGARSEVSMYFLGICKIILGIFLGGGNNMIEMIFKVFPNSVLGIMLIFAGIELASMAKDVGGLDRKGHDSFVTTLVGGLAAFGFANDGIGFLCGLACFILLAIQQSKEEIGSWSGLFQTWISFNFRGFFLDLFLLWKNSLTERL